MTSRLLLLQPSSLAHFHILLHLQNDGLQRRTQIGTQDDIDEFYDHSFTMELFEARVG